MLATWLILKTHVAGARAVYGSKFDALFDPVVPVPEERLIVKEDGETLTIGPGRTLQFWHTPGHAAHHFSIYDPVSNGVFTGDTAGIRYHQTNDVGLEFYLRRRRRTSLTLRPC